MVPGAVRSRVQNVAAGVRLAGVLGANVPGRVLGRVGLRAVAEEDDVAAVDSLPERLGELLVPRVGAAEADDVDARGVVQGLLQAFTAIVASANGFYLAALHQFVKGLQGFLQRGFIVKAMCLVEVNVVGPKSLQRSVDRFENVLAR